MLDAEATLRKLREELEQFDSNIDARMGMITGDLARIMEELEKSQVELRLIRGDWARPIFYGVISGVVVLMIVAIFLWLAPTALPNVTLTIAK